jgi:hypothetical protein
MSAETFAYTLDLLRGAGVEIVVKDGSPHLRGRQSALTPEVRGAVEAHRDQLAQRAAARDLLDDLRRVGAAVRVTTDAEDTRWLCATSEDGLPAGLLHRLEAQRGAVIDLLTEDHAP